MASSKQNLDQISKYPEGDIFHNYNPDNSPNKFDYLQGKYMFRFPFTLTSMKWGLSLGVFFGLHTYFKSSLNCILFIMIYCILYREFGEFVILVHFWKFIHRLADMVKNQKNQKN